MNEIQAIRKNHQRREIDKLRKLIPEMNRKMAELRRARQEHPELFGKLKFDDG